MVFIHNGILYSYNTEGNTATSDSMDGFWGHYTKWKKKKEREREREQIGGCQKRMGRVGKIGWVSQNIKKKNKIKNKVEWIYSHTSIYPYPHP